MTERKFYTPSEWAALSIDEKHEVEKKQLWLHLDEFGVDAANVFLDSLREGKIQGNQYWDSGFNSYGDACGCVLGTLVFAKTKNAYRAREIRDGRDFSSTQYLVDCDYDYNDSDDTYWNADFSVVEALAYNIEVGDTPENNENARLLAEWTQEWISNQTVTA